MNYPEWTQGEDHRKQLVMNIGGQELRYNPKGEDEGEETSERHEKHNEVKGVAQYVYLQGAHQLGEVEHNHSVAPKPQKSPIGLRRDIDEWNNIAQENCLANALAVDHQKDLEIEVRSFQPRLVVLRVLDELLLLQFFIEHGVYHNRQRGVHHVHQLIHIGLIKSHSGEVLVSNGVEELRKDKHDILPEVVQDQIGVFPVEFSSMAQ